MDMTWNSGGSEFRWPWMLPVLILLVIGLLVWWARSRGRPPAGAAYVAAGVTGGTTVAPRKGGATIPKG